MIGYRLLHSILSLAADDLFRSNAREAAAEAAHVVREELRLALLASITASGHCASVGNRGEIVEALPFAPVVESGRVTHLLGRRSRRPRLQDCRHHLRLI